MINLRETQETQSMHEMEFLAVNLMDRVLASLAQTHTVGPSSMEISLLYLLGTAAMVVAAKFAGGTDLTLPHLAYTANVDDIMANGGHSLEDAIQRLRCACFGGQEPNVNTCSWDLDSDSDGSCAPEGPSADEGVPIMEDTHAERETNDNGILKTPERPTRPSSAAVAMSDNRYKRRKKMASPTTEPKTSDSSTGFASLEAIKLLKSAEFLLLVLLDWRLFAGARDAEKCPTSS